MGEIRVRNVRLTMAALVYARKQRSKIHWGVIYYHWPFAVRATNKTG
jgi:hypothetical protein